MSPADAAKTAGVAAATASRYYEKWDAEIKKGREENLMPQIEESLRALRKKRKPAKKR